VTRQAKFALVTGGAGFIGSHLCDRLVADGARVIVLDNLQTGRMANIEHLLGSGHFDFVRHDVVDDFPSMIAALPFTHIYHLACAASPDQYQADPEHTLLTNVLGTRNALRLAERTGARLLLTSTSEVYGDPEIHPQSEEYRGAVNCTGPRACYDEGKRAAEALAFDFQRLGRAEVRVARIFNTYGPRMQADDGRVVSNLVRQMLSGEEVTIYGEGTQTRCFCYVSDTVEGLLRLMDSDDAVGMPVNLGDPREMTVNHLAELLVLMTGGGKRIVHLPLPQDDPRRRKPDISRAREMLKWHPTIGLEDGLQATIDWFQKELARPDYAKPLLATAAE
jgi:UDP-glucuronate decarboxylase